MIVYNKTTLVIFTTVAALGILTASTVLTIQPAHALTKFFNCTTAVANKTHNLTLQDVNACYNKEFHSSGGAGAGITPTTTTTTESGVHRSSLHHYGTIRTSIHSPSSSERSNRASSQNEGFSSSSAAAAAASTDEIPGSDSGVDSSSISASGDVAASSSSSGGASASSTATAR
ncbi:MAG: hypothetical protein JO327_12345 [Nitrososphaeraceae archaeon]|nr:hypothetical protein [Nitrososphaeraceae archaeon]